MERLIILGRLALATLTGTSVRFVYMDEDGVTSMRHVEPLQLLTSLQGDAYVQTFDLNRRDTRNFRIDRIIAVVA